MKACIRTFFALTILTGIIYPLVVTALANILFSNRAHGSLVLRDGKIIGSTLIGQPFTSDKYFWSRPSATAPYPYNATASSGSNLGPTNEALLSAVTERVTKLQEEGKGTVPIDLVTSSASGLDPHISIASARFQVARVARARKLEEKKINALIDQNTEGRTFYLFGEPRVNVLLLNIALDESMNSP